MRLQGRLYRWAIVALLTWINISQSARGQATSAPASPESTNTAAASSAGAAPTAAPARFNDLLGFLPAAVRDGLDANIWSWATYDHLGTDPGASYSTGAIALDVTKSFQGRFALTVEADVYDDNGEYIRGQVEQAFASALLNRDAGTILTAGKFNASFGTEPRDVWNRLTVTPSLIFSAQPQDLLGIMLTQSIGPTGITVRPFVADGFEGHFNPEGPPAAGIRIEYRPVHELLLAATGWVGPGFVPDKESADDEEYPSYQGTPITDGWMGPDLYFEEQGGTLYLVDANVTWTPRDDLTIEAESLLALESGSESGQWNGFLVLVNYQLTDQWRVYARYSALNDPDGIVTSLPQHRQEISGGVGWQICHGIEIRGEYRHDFNPRLGDLDTVSAALSLGY
jgi:hypothetical protein